MDAGWANWVVGAVGVYAALGFLFALAFVSRGVGRIDPGARQATWAFRLLILPGTVALWPLLARRWLSGQTEPPEERNSHRLAARK